MASGLVFGGLAENQLVDWESLVCVSVRQWSVFVVGQSVEDLSVGWWLVVGGRWPVGGQWFCNIPSLRTTRKELVWCSNDPNVHIPTFCERWSFIWRCFFLVSILKPSTKQLERKFLWFHRLTRKKTGLVDLVWFFLKLLVLYLGSIYNWQLSTSSH